jgi:hypothetical protein
MNLRKSNFLWILPSALLLGASLSSLQPGNWWIGFASFSLLFFLSLSLFTVSLRWAGAGKTLAYILVLTFALRLLVGVSLYVFLPIYGHDDADDKAGFVFTDARIRDDQAWYLASSDRPILDAFSRKFSSDQYGGLLAFSAFVYRYLSPDAQRPLLLILLSALVAALGVPFLWLGTRRVFGEKVAYAAAWIFALYPESILLGSSAMREPYLLTFSAMALWGFVEWRASTARGFETSAKTTRPTQSASLGAWILLGFGLLGMLLISPAIALATLVIFAGWIFFTRENRSISWKAILVFGIVFMVALLFLSASLNRSGEFESTSPLRVVNNWLRLAVKWNAYQIERESGWVQKLFDEMPEWMRLPFVAVYGILQPVLPAALIAPTEPIWKMIYILRALGWYALLPMLILSFMAGSGSGWEKKRAERSRSIILWLSLLAWTWILLAAIRGGGDMWDNPRYRTILFVWQAILAGVVWVWWRETRNVWFGRVMLCEASFLIIFTQWYASRYFHLGGQLPFAGMVALIFGLWVAILGVGWLLDRRRAG